MCAHRNLQNSPISCCPTRAEVSKPLAAQLTKSVLGQYRNQQRELSVVNRVTDSVKAYLQTLEDSGHSSPPHPANSQFRKVSPSSLGQWKPRQESGHKISDVDRSLKNMTVGSVSQEAEQSETDFVPLRETVSVQPAPVPQKHSSVQGNDNTGLKYLSRAFNKLGISNGLPALHDDPETQLKQPSESAAEQSQSLHARRRLNMGEASVCTGRPSAYENSFSSCDIKSLASDWSVNSWSTFNTHDEQEFRNGLAALDASIASLQRTLKADLKR